MLKKLSFFIKLPFTGILMIILIIAMALATFIESASGVNEAWALIYDAWWFELIFILVLINLLGNMFVSKLFRRSKITVLTFHLAFILIIVGGGITRFLSTEGMMHIREGKVSGTMIGNDTYLDVSVRNGDFLKQKSKKVRLSASTPGRYRWSTKINGRSLKVRSVAYLRNATPQYVAGPGGSPYLQLVLVSGRQISDGLVSGDIREYPGLTLSFNNVDAPADMKVVSDENGLYAYSEHQVEILSMGGNEAQVYEPGAAIPFEPGKLFSVKGVKLAIQNYMPSAKLQYVPADEGAQGRGVDVIQVEAELDGMRSMLYLQGSKNVEGLPARVSMGGLEIEARYGSHGINLPFVLRLDDFRIDRYPGSNSPSSFESDVVLIDMEQGINEHFQIYMNNVLKHRGYRFYQSSYDPDEMGTVLSVNRDTFGTVLTYIGYLFMTLGMVFALFAKGTRFARLARATAQHGVSKAAIVLVFLTFSMSLWSQDYPTPDRVQASEFGKLWVQGKEGRFKPMNTLSNEVMRKVIKESEFRGLSADQAMLGMIVFPEEWKNAPLFEVEHSELHQMLAYKGAFVSFNDFIVDGRYILSEIVNNAYNKRVQDRTDLDKEVMKLDEKINVFYMVQTGGLLKIFPDPKDENHTWLAVSDLLEADHTVSDTLGQVFLLYTRALREGDIKLAGDILTYISNYQIENSSIELHSGKAKAEIFYNKMNLFSRMALFYGLFGLILVILQFFRIFRPARWVEYLFKVGVIHLSVAFVLHTLGLAVRWYISGHAPLSNGYESMIFVSWISLLAGLIFLKRTGFAIALTAVLSALSLLVAHMSWMTPDITNLVPVLKSPWLTIHVTVIMAGYGFLGLSMLMGLINLVFYALINPRNSKKILNVLEQVTKVNHLALIIGLYFLTVGMFLGGVWANESWGRYWGWDPKETWALISVLVYAFITHMHHFPGMKGSYAFNLATLLGFLSILMTYFGVNYFLGGIHSYAGGAAFSIPWWVYLFLAAIVLLSYVAHLKNKKFQSDYLEE